MGFGADTVDKAFELVLGDDRRKLDPDADAAAKRIWRQAFGNVPEEPLLAAVLVWLKEHQKGRPNVGEISAILKRSLAQAEPETAQNRAHDAERLRELSWAVDVLSHPHRYETGDYRHTIEYAQRCVRWHKFTNWQDAKAFLEPGLTSSTVTDIYI